MKNLVMIDIKKLVPHPDNPRKNLGDLTELADSIKAVGIMQNLTVVPFEDKYRILIGHRRAAAAKEAGLTELPCIISEVPEKDQIEIMLLENMQRSDLTVLEESQGLQMMIEMGNSVADICKKTGFSESKVRHRVKLTELDQKILQKKLDENKNISIMDLQKLEQIKDPNRKDRVLKVIGTSNFEMALKKAVDEEKYLEWEKEILAQLPEEIERIDDTKEKQWMCSLRERMSNDETLEKIEDFDGKMYWRKGYSSIEIYIDAPESFLKKREEAREKRRLLDERKNAIKSILKRMRDMRKEFVCGLSNRDCGYFLFHEPEMQKILLSALAEGSVREMDLLDFLNIKIENEPKPWETKKWEEILVNSIDGTNMKRALLCGLYLSMEPQNYDDPFDYYGRFKSDRKYRDVYKFMKIIGYQLSDEEKQILDGTHELYVKEEEDE